ncbi:hypothetical protein MTR_2g074900 [Medicago truncatula]|uniref:Non-specific serine/threonine protein kinase n=1 Tax=Medicago truncatula TaxID=3880 RepID=G7IJD6_MEDTR|nr:hypothetical protein MTR_2g074900 [Medicago truncatula]
MYANEKINKARKTLIYIVIYLIVSLDFEKLDLSFNRLRGTIPSNYADMSNANFIFLTGNLLTGQVPPAWGKNSDV